MIEAGVVQDERELQQILDLQRANLARNLTAEAIRDQGFVTVEHTLDVLKRMDALAPSIVARDGQALAGYALVMLVECRSWLPILEPMFLRLDRLGMADRRFYVMGQICVAAPWRGRGVFDLLYRTHRQQLRTSFDFSVTEVSMRNTRSMRAHQRIGFKEIDRYRDASDEWSVMGWDWS